MEPVGPSLSADETESYLNIRESHWTVLLCLIKTPGSDVRVGFLWFLALSRWLEDWARVIIIRHWMQRRHPLASIVFYNCIMIKRALYSSLGVTDLEQFFEGNVVIWPRCLSTEKQSCLVFRSMSWLLLHVLTACICSSSPQTHKYLLSAYYRWGPVFGRVEESSTLERPY